MDFLPNKPAPKPNTESGTGGKFNVKNSVFFDNYLHHLELHNIFSLPPLPSEFQRLQNYELVRDNTFAEDRIKSKISNGWYGEGTDYNSLINGYTAFQKPDLLSKTINEVESEITADLFSGIEKPKMKINDKFGMFSYDLASMAMTYVYEYFDIKGKKVDSNYVVKKADKFYFENEEVYQKVKRRENGTPVVISSVRKCLIDFEKKEKENRAVEIIVINSASASVKANDFIFNSMAAIAVAQNLILKGFQVKITALLTTEYNNIVYYHFIPTKRYNQPMDINATAYVCGDTRFYRFQGFKAYVSGFDRNNVNCPGGLGGSFDDKKDVAKIIENDYVPNSKLKQADTRLYFGGSRNLQDVKKEVNEALLILNAKYGNQN
jgi:hypothetical protein